MTRSRLTVLTITLGSLLALPMGAAEVPAYTPDASLLPARQPVEAPLRVAEALSLEALATLAPAREGAAADLAALAEWNSAGLRPTRVGFARALSHPLELRYDVALLPGRVGSRVGGGFLARRANGPFVWGTSVEIAEAKGIRLELADVNLPAGTRFWVYGMGGEARTFDLRLLREDRTILSPTIYGDRIYLEVELPDAAGVSAAASPGLTISRVFELAIDDAGEATAELVVPEEGECADNAECFDSGDFPGIGSARKGVFRYTYQNGSSLFTCSGGLLNDADASTLQPWLLTADHCLSSQSRALSLDSRFFWRFAGCASGASVYTFGPTGADLIVHSDTTDVALARAIDATEVPAGVTYLGWTTTRPADGSILHRLSHPVVGNVTQPQMYSTHQIDDTPAFFCGSPYTTTNFISSVNIASTGIAGGSSGSPVMRPDGLIVGQLFGACGSPPDGCATGDTANILDGAFATSYPLLAPYIDVAGTACFRDADTACLLNGKFKVEVDWTTSSATGTAKVMSFNGERAESTESAFFWFFNATNFEMGVKMVDACVAPFNRYWVFFSGLTSQGYQVKVTRMSDGLVKIYPPNPVGNIPTTTADTDAFTCP